MKNFQQHRLDQLAAALLLLLHVAEGLEFDQLHGMLARVLTRAAVLADEREDAHGLVSRQ